MRDTIVRVAGELFADRGPDDVGFDEIAATVGISAHHLRAYFTSTTAVRAAVAAACGGAGNDLEEDDGVGTDAQLVA